MLGAHRLSQQGISRSGMGKSPQNHLRTLALSLFISLLTTDELTALDTELTQYESDFAAMKALRKRAKSLQVDMTKWQPPYDVESYTKQVELAERLIEEMKGLISKAKTLHVDLKTTTINDVPVLQQPYQESVVQQLDAS